MAERRKPRKKPEYDAMGNVIKVGQVYRYGNTITATVRSIGTAKIRMEYKQDGVPKKWNAPTNIPLNERFQLIKDV